MIKETPKTLILLPNNSTEIELAQQISTATNYKIFNASEIEKSKQPFISEEKQ